jgi:raffinose/stachyose/melibiose transport system substrate-binding protein
MARLYREKHPNVIIVQDAIPEGTYGQWVSTQLMGGTAPDIMQVGAMLPDNIWLSYYNRYFAPLTRYVNAPNPTTPAPTSPTCRSARPTRTA